MSQNSFEIAFSGQLVEGANADSVRQNLAKLFNSTPQKLKSLFSGQRVVIKKNLDETSARKYLEAMRKAGALAELSNTQAPPAQKNVAAPPTPANTGPASAGRATSYPGPTQALSDVSIAEPGALLTQARAVREAQIDISDLSMAEPGAILGKEKTVTPAPIDTTGLSMAEPGAPLTHPHASK